MKSHVSTRAQLREWSREHQRTVVSMRGEGETERAGPRLASSARKRRGVERGSKHERVATTNTTQSCGARCKSRTKGEKKNGAKGGEGAYHFVS